MIETVIRKRIEILADGPLVRRVTGSTVQPVIPAASMAAVTRLTKGPSARISMRLRMTVSIMVQSYASIRVAAAISPMLIKMLNGKVTESDIER